MADIKISQLSPVLAVQDADVFPMTANGSNMTGKAAASIIKDYMIGNTSIAGIGDGTPTGAIKNIYDNMPGGPEDLGIGYGTCNTAAATLAKEASLTGYELVKNGYVSVLFTYDVPAGANLSINSKTAKSIYYHGSAITAGIINAGDVATFVYDGVNYNLVGVDNSITQIENLKTNQGTLSSLTTTAKSSLVAAINEVDGDVDAAFDSIAPTEDGVTVSQDYAIGEEFYRGGVLYKAKTAITASTAWSSLVLNTNYEATTVGSQIQALANNKLNRVAVSADNRIETIGNVPQRQYEPYEMFLASDGNTYRAKTTISTSTILNSGSGGNCERTYILTGIDNLIKTLTIKSVEIINGTVQYGLYGFDISRRCIPLPSVFQDNSTGNRLIPIYTFSQTTGKLIAAFYDANSLDMMQSGSITGTQYYIDLT